jgi:hypothetical protein
MALKRPLVWGDDTQSLREIRDDESLVGVPAQGGNTGGDPGVSVTANVQSVMAGGMALKDGEVKGGDAVFLRMDDAGNLRCARASAEAGGHAAEALAAQVIGDRVWFCQHCLVSGYTGLVPGAAVFLNAHPGWITMTPPNAVGQVVQRIGTAITEGMIHFAPGVARLILGE